jgi:hypothetical protein
MKLSFIILLFIFDTLLVLNLSGQPGEGNRCDYKDFLVADNRPLKQAGDFTITTTDGITRNLYNTLDSGKTVFIDLFYTTCSWCQYYAPVIEEIYQNTGAGLGDIEFWGISNNLFDTNNIIDQYRLDYNISNPCAGPFGGGTTAFSIIVDGQNFQGFPTYCVICPDRTLYFDPCYPPVVTGFDPYFESCDTLTGLEDHGAALRPGIISIHPNPAHSFFIMEVTSNDPYPLVIEIYNILGIKSFSTSYDAVHGMQSISIPVENLPRGTYFIRLMQNGLYLDSKQLCISR